jgi:Glutamate synthase central domain
VADRVAVPATSSPSSPQRWRDAHLRLAIVDDAELKRDVASRFPYRKWLDKNVFEIERLEGGPPPPPRITGDELMRLARAHGYTDKRVGLLIEAIARDGKEPIGSMGTDTPLAVLSDQAANLFAYFHKLSRRSPTRRSRRAPSRGPSPCRA